MAASPELEGSTMDDKHVYPLNLRRLKVVIITQIARGLGLPTNASLSETRGLIEGKLGEDREPRNVQVIVIGEGVIVKLRDEGGVFAEIPADVGTTERPDRDGGEDGVYPVEEEEEVEEELTGMTSSRHRDDMYAQEELELELELEEVKKQLETTQIEVKKLMEELEKTRESYERALEVKDQVVSDLTDTVKHEKERYHTLWRMNVSSLRIMTRTRLVEMRSYGPSGIRLPFWRVNLVALPGHHLQASFLHTGIELLIVGIGLLIGEQ